MLRLNPSEGYEQTTVVNAFERAGYTLFSVPNEGERGVIEAARLQRQGLRAGAPDLVVVELAPLNGRPTMIEMKRRKGAKTSKDQLEMHAVANAAGWNVLACPKGQSAAWVLEQARRLGYCV